MANTLLDAIKQSQTQNQQAATQTIGAGAPSETQNLANTLAVGQTGKAQAAGTGAAPVPKMSNLQEKLANVQTKLGTQALAQQNQTQQVQQEQDADVAKRESQIQFADLEEKKQQVQKNYTNQVQATLDNWRQQGRQLDLSKDKAKMEQIGFQLRLSNNQYIQDLKTQGIKSRLTSQLKRKETIAQTVFADEQDLMQNNLQFQQMLNAKGRDLTQQLANIDLDTALQMADAQNKAANEQMMWKGIGNLAGAGVQAAGKIKATGPNTDYSNTSAYDNTPATEYEQAGTSSIAAGGGYGGGGRH